MRGYVMPIAGGPSVLAPSACQVAGGWPIAVLGGRPVAATIPYGKGSVTVLGFGSRFSDANMGVVLDAVPDANLQSVFELEYALVRAIIEDTLLPKPSSSRSSPR